MTLGAELHNASYSYQDVMGGRDIVFHDPFDGPPLNPSRVPLSTATQPHLLAGLNHLSRISHESGHSITIAGASHSKDSVFDMAELINLVDSHDTIFLEGIGHTERDRRIVREVGQGRSDLPDDLLADQYKTLQLAAISGHQKFVTYADIPGDGTPYETALIEWGDLVRPLARQARTERDITTKKNLFRAAHINIAGNTILREWQMLGSIGNSLHEAERQGYPVDHSLFLIGTEHTRTLPKKLGLLGVTNSAIELTMHNQGTSETIDYEPFNFTTAVRNYRARLRQP